MPPSHKQGWHINCNWNKICGNKEDFPASNMNKQAVIKLVVDGMQQKGCHVIHAKGDADVDIVRAAGTMSYINPLPSLWIGEDTNLLVLLLYYYAAQYSRELYFRSDKDKIVHPVMSILNVPSQWYIEWVVPINVSIFQYIVAALESPRQLNENTSGVNPIWVKY